ncbi:MAG: Ldh family oxidoreductase [Chloroflexi bacterium]|nr:Ldh family oxidoreductase [Chloroflexota bacterium]
MAVLKRRISAESLTPFVEKVLLHYGLPEEDARIGAEVLVHADLMGIDSHGVAHLAENINYVPGLKLGYVNPRPKIRAIRETPTTALVDADRGFGMVVGHRAMNIAIDKAKEAGIGAVTVINACHFGAAGHYALMAVPHDMIGISSTNAPPQVAPTYARHRMFGTNPLAVAVPAGKEPPFLLDIATSVVAHGKLEIAAREERPIPPGWAVDASGRSSEDPMAVRGGGALMPLGSSPELSSHKGFGLSMVVDILCGVLSGQGYGMLLTDEPRQYGHFFQAIRIDCFRPVSEFKAMMDELLMRVRTAEPVRGEKRVYYPGLKEYEAEKERREKGIPLNPKVVSALESLGREIGIEL